jgi:hypothetical protein
MAEEQIIRDKMMCFSRVLVEKLLGLYFGDVPGELRDKWWEEVESQVVEPVKDLLKGIEAPLRYDYLKILFFFTKKAEIEPLFAEVRQREWSIRAGDESLKKILFERVFYIVYDVRNHLAMPGYGSFRNIFRYPLFLTV